MTDTPSSDMARIEEMLAAGASDVITTPVRPEKLVKKLETKPAKKAALKFEKKIAKH